MVNDGERYIGFVHDRVSSCENCKRKKMKKEKVTLSRIDKVEFFFNKYLGNGIFIYYKIKGRRIKFIVNLKYKLFDSNRFEMEDTRSLGNFDATG